MNPGTRAVVAGSAGVAPVRFSFIPLPFIPLPVRLLGRVMAKWKHWIFGIRHSMFPGLLGFFQFYCAATEFLEMP